MLKQRATGTGLHRTAQHDEVMMMWHQDGLPVIILIINTLNPPVIILIIKTLNPPVIILVIKSLAKAYTSCITHHPSCITHTRTHTHTHTPFSHSTLTLGQAWVPIL